MVVSGLVTRGDLLDVGPACSALTKGDVAADLNHEDVSVERQQVLQVAVELVDGGSLAALVLCLLESLELRTRPLGWSVRVLHPQPAAPARCARSRRWPSSARRLARSQRRLAHALTATPSPETRRSPAATASPPESVVPARRGPGRGHVRCDPSRHARRRPPSPRRHHRARPGAAPRQRVSASSARRDGTATGSWAAHLPSRGRTAATRCAASAPRATSAARCWPTR